MCRPRVRITIEASVAGTVFYEAHAHEFNDGNWTPVCRDDGRPMEPAAGDRETARRALLTALDNKFGEDGYELVDEEP